jgi:hypothetical protein
MTIQANQGFGVSVFGATSSGGGGATSPGGSSLQIQYNAAGSFGGMAGTSWDNTNRSLTLTGATVTTSQPVLNLSQTWNDAAATFTGLKFNVTDTASASASLLMDLQVGGSSKFSVTKAGQIYTAVGQIAVPTSLQINSGNTNDLRALTASTIFGNAFQLGSGITPDIYLTRIGAASLRLGAADAAAPVAQTLGVQSVVAGTTNTAGTNFTIKGSAGTGTGAGGSIIFQVAPAGSTGTAQNAFATGMELTSGKYLLVGNPSAGFSNTGLLAMGLSLGTNAGSVATVAGEQIIVYASNVKVGEYIFGTRFKNNSAFTYEWSSTSAASGTSDLILARDAANTLALRNGTSAQTFNIYGSYTDTSNYERLSITVSTTGIVFNSQGAGTGTGRYIQFISAQGAYFDLATGNGINFRSSAGTSYWQINSSGHFLAGTDNTYDIGASGANRPRNVFVANNISVGSSVTVDSVFSHRTGSVLFGGTDGNWRLTNNAGTDFDRLQFGGTTSSFPALKRSSTTLQARLADDSAYAPIQGKLTTDTAYAATAPTATGYLVIYDSTGTAYKVPAVAA